LEGGLFRIKVVGIAALDYSGSLIQFAVFRDKKIRHCWLTFLDFFHRETSWFAFIIYIPDVAGWPRYSKGRSINRCLMRQESQNRIAYNATTVTESGRSRLGFL